MKLQANLKIYLHRNNILFLYLASIIFVLSAAAAEAH